MVPKLPSSTLPLSLSFPETDGIPSERYKYDTVQREIYWPHRAGGVYKTVAYWPKCFRNRPIIKRKRHLQPSPTNRPKEYISMDVMWSLPKTRSGNQFIIVITDRYKKLSLLSRTESTALHVVSFLFSHRIVQYGSTDWFSQTTVCSSIASSRRQFIRSSGYIILQLQPAITKRRANRNATTKSSLPFCVIMLPKTNANGILLYNH